MKPIKCKRCMTVLKQGETVDGDGVCHACRTEWFKALYSGSIVHEHVAHRESNIALTDKIMRHGIRRERLIRSATLTLQ